VIDYGAGNGANWHPSAAFHMLRGEMLVWIYGLVLFEAIDLVEHELKELSLEEIANSKSLFLYPLLSLELTL
jgi:hypothetical protein